MTPQGVIRKHSGGIVVLVRETWANRIAVWKTARDGTRIWLRLGNAFQRPLFLCIIYVVPQGSPYADSSLFEHICQEVGEAMSLGGVLLAGDFNVKTSTNTDFIDCSQLVDVLLVPQAIEHTLPNDVLECHNRDTITAGWHCESWISTELVGCSSSMAAHQETYQGNTHAYPIKVLALWTIFLRQLTN